MVHGSPASVLPAPEADIINPSSHLVHDTQSSVVLLAASKSSGSLVLTISQSGHCWGSDSAWVTQVAKSRFT